MIRIIKDNLALFVALLLPFILIVIILVFMYVPRLFSTPPQSDFVYSVNDNNYSISVPRGGGGCYISYVLRDNQITKAIENDGCEEDEDPEVAQKLFVYRSDEGTREEVSFEDVDDWQLDGQDVSPDGYELVRKRVNQGGVFIFNLGGLGDYKWYLENSNDVRYEVDLGTDGSYRSDIKFLGWVTEM